MDKIYAINKLIKNGFAINNDQLFVWCCNGVYVSDLGSFCTDQYILCPNDTQEWKVNEKTYGKEGAAHIDCIDYGGGFFGKKEGCLELREKLIEHIEEKNSIDATVVRQEQGEVCTHCGECVDDDEDGDTYEVRVKMEYTDIDNFIEVFKKQCSTQYDFYISLGRGT